MYISVDKELLTSKHVALTRKFKGTPSIIQKLCQQLYHLITAISAQYICINNIIDYILIVPTMF